MNSNITETIMDYCIMVIEEIDKIIRKTNKKMFKLEDLADTKESLEKAKFAIEELEKKLA